MLIFGKIMREVYVKMSYFNEKLLIKSLNFLHISKTIVIHLRFKQLNTINIYVFNQVET